MHPENIKAQDERVGWTVAAWGRRYGFSASKSYELIRTGKGPRVAVVGGDRLITIDADAEWRRSLAEQAA
jgi:hypothetical protein